MVDEYYLGGPACPRCGLEMTLLSVVGRLVTYRCYYCGSQYVYEDPRLRGSILDESELPDLPDSDYY